MVIEGKIIEVLTGAGVGNIEEVLTGALSRGVRNANDDDNKAVTNKVTAAGGPKGEDAIWSVIVVVIALGRLIVDKGL